MRVWQKEAWFVSLFVLLGIFDLLLRFFLLEREHWTCNEGITWGIMIPSWSLSLTVGIFLGYISYLWWKSEQFEERFFLFLMLGGGLTNALDRFLHGCVLDYFVWPFGLSNFLPNFNLADMMLFLGLVGVGKMILKWKH